MANPDLEVMSSRRVRHSAGPGLESATLPTGCRFTALLQTTHLLGTYLFCTSQKMFLYKHYLSKKILCTNHITTYCIYMTIRHWKIFRENDSIIVQIKFSGAFKIC